MIRKLEAFMLQKLIRATTLPTMSETLQSPNVTEDGLVIKNTARIERIESRMEKRLTVQVFSWQISRVIRRDFNLLSAKMYMRGQDKKQKAQISELLLELSLQSASLKAESTNFSDDPNPTIRELPIRIVSPESAMLYQALKEADKVYARLGFAYREHQITERSFNERCHSFESAYSDLKRYIIGIATSNKTAAEIGQEKGIS